MDHIDHHAGLDTDSGFVQVTNPEAAAVFSAALRQAREEAGITLERAAILTRISPIFIQALESGDFKALPGVVFARGFVRNLCKPYRKNASDMLKLFDLAIRCPEEAARGGASAEGGVNAQAKHRRARTPFNASRFFAVWTSLTSGCEKVKEALAPHKRPLFLGMGTVSLALLVGGIVAYLPEKPQGEVSAELPAKTAAVSPAVATEAEEPEEVEAVSEAATVSRSESKEPPPALPVKKQESKVAASPEAAPLSVGFKSESASGRQIVEVSAKSQVVVRFSKDGAAFETRTLEPRTHSFEFENEAQMLVFDASAVEVKFNGRALGPLGSKGRVRRISFRKEDLAEDKKL